MFRTVRDRADDIFVKLPPPTPKRASFQYGMHGGAGARSAPAPRPVQMAAYHNAQGGCFAGSSLCHLADGRRVPVGQLRKGDLLAAPTEGDAAGRVLCVVRTACPTGTADMVMLGPTGKGQCMLTPFHPVRIGNKWKFPKDLAAVEEVPCKAVFNLVLDAGHIAMINGVSCVTLGHGLQEEVRGTIMSSRSVAEILYILTFCFAV